MTIERLPPILVRSKTGPDRTSTVAEDGEVRATLEMPQTADVREVIEMFEAVFENVEMVAKSEHERTVQAATEYRESVAAKLTEKQRAALEAAYFAGYYDWPRAYRQRARRVYGGVVVDPVPAPPTRRPGPDRGVLRRAIAEEPRVRIGTLALAAYRLRDRGTGGPRSRVDPPGTETQARRVRARTRYQASSSAASS